MAMLRGCLHTLWISGLLAFPHQRFITNSTAPGAIQLVQAQGALPKVKAPDSWPLLNKVDVLSDTALADRFGKSWCQTEVKCQPFKAWFPDGAIKQPINPKSYVKWIEGSDKGRGMFASSQFTNGEVIMNTVVACISEPYEEETEHGKVSSMMHCDGGFTKIGKGAKEDCEYNINRDWMKVNSKTAKPNSNRFMCDLTAGIYVNHNKASNAHYEDMGYLVKDGVMHGLGYALVADRAIYADEEIVISYGGDNGYDKDAKSH